MLRRFELNPRAGIIAATVLIVALGSTRFLIGWDKVDLGRDLLGFVVFGIGAIAGLAFLIASIAPSPPQKRRALSIPPDSHGPIIDLEAGEPVGQRKATPKTGSSEG